MLSLHLTVGDLAGPWRFDDGAWRSGDSLIKPFAHRLIHSHAVDAVDGLVVVVREHASGGGEHGGRQRSPDTTAELLRGIIDWPLNAAAIAIPADRTRCVTIAASGHVTAPVFLASHDDVLLGDWDVARFYGRLPLDLDEERLAFSLCYLGLPYSRRTLFRNVWQLTERAQAAWGPVGQSVLVRYPPPRRRRMPRRLRAAADVIAAFSDVFASAVRRSAGQEPIACEVSGGLDSAVALLLARRALGPERVRAFGLILPGAQSISQRMRRAELLALAGIDDTAIEAERRGPFSFTGDMRLDPAFPWGEYYREAFQPLSMAMAEQGYDAVLRGLGGDEISELLAEEREVVAGTGEVLPDVLPDYLTPRARAALHRLTDVDAAPAGAAPSSFYQSTAASAPLYMRRGIWPICPYGLAEIVDFCRSLPTAWRRDRMLQRNLLEAAGLSPEVVRPRMPENFLPLRDEMFRGCAADHVRQLFGAPLLARTGLVSATLLARAFEAAAEDANSDERTRLMEAAMLEATLRDWTGGSMPSGS